MKKLIALQVFGAFVLATGVLAPLYVYPAVSVIPGDLHSAVVAQSPDGSPASYFDIASLSPAQARLRSVTTASVDSRLSDEASKELGRPVLVIPSYVCTDTVGTDCAEQEYPLASQISTYAVDPSSGEPVTWEGARVETGGKTTSGTDIEGLTIKFPFHTRKKTYEFWNSDVSAPVPVRFVRTTTIHGLDVYKYRQSVAPTVVAQVDVPGSVIDRDEPSVRVDNVVSGSTTYLVEPESGVVMSATAQLDNYAAIGDERVLTLTRGTLVTPAGDAADSVREYKSLAGLLHALRVVVPAVAIPLGAALLVTGIALHVRATRRRSRVDEDGARA